MRISGVRAAGWRCLTESLASLSVKLMVHQGGKNLLVFNQLHNIGSVQKLSVSTTFLPAQAAPNCLHSLSLQLLTVPFLVTLVTSPCCSRDSHTAKSQIRTTITLTPSLVILLQQYLSTIQFLLLHYSSCAFIYQ